MTCKKCGLELKRSDKFCPRCGEIVPKQKTSTTKKVIAISLTIIVLAIACSIIIPIISVNSQPSPKVYKNTSKVFEENNNSNYKSNVKKNLNTSEAETKAEKGIITGQVLDDLGNPIENAEVCAIVVREAETKDNAENVSDTSGNDSEIKTKTDKEGKYSIECLVGEYKIQITADGYDGFISEKYVTVSAGKTVNIDKITIKKIDTTPQIVQALLDNESTWQEFPNDYVNADLGCNDYISCWFQDMDMDGNPEFIVGPMISGAHSAHDFCIWKNNNGNLEKFCIEDEELVSPASSDIFTLWPGNNDKGSESFTSKLFLNTDNNKYYYFFYNEDGVYNETYWMSDLFDCSSKKISSKYSITEHFESEGSNPIRTFTFDNNEVSQDQFLSDYNAYFSKLKSYSITVKDINYLNYRSLSTDEKKKLLIDSFNAWNYNEDKNIALPLAEKISEILENSNESSVDSSNSTDVEKISREELAIYLSADFYEFINRFSDMYDVGATSGTEYRNEYLTISTDNPGSSTDGIQYISIDADCDYTLYGVYYGMDAQIAIDTLKNQSTNFKKSTDTLYYFYMPNNVTVGLYFLNGSTIDGIFASVN
ncbi:MAG: carboxypeptidase regulatory-like domain-containing protein [Ruminococcus callidus]|nr:carboxypeptidase regulatory-like domain-containing protein [Ruminococcus callidus]